MNKIVEIATIRRQIITEKQQRSLDAQASIVLIKNCLSYLKMNNLLELENLKDEMKETIRKLEELL